MALLFNDKLYHDECLLDEDEATAVEPGDDTECAACGKLFNEVEEEEVDEDEEGEEIEDLTVEEDDLVEDTENE